MSDTEGTKAKGWTDKERLTFLFALIENSNVKFDYNATPRPTGRSSIACQRMVERLKGTLKNELDALKSGNPIDEGAPKKIATPKSTPRKRKTKDTANANGDAEATPTKRGRKKKVVEPEPEPEPEVNEDDDDDEQRKVKKEKSDEEALFGDDI